MIYRRLDNNGDYSFGNNLQNFVLSAEAVGQAIKTRLLLLQGEWWEDTSQGLPLFQNILGQPGTSENLASADLLIKDIIANTPNVTGISDFKSTYKNRKYGFICKVDTIYGTTPMEVSF